MHGENLICSYENCAALGVKFCYCAYCGIPVAKRNFRQRHDHDEKKSRQKVPKATVAAVASNQKQPGEESAQSSSTGNQPSDPRPSSSEDADADGKRAATQKASAEEPDADGEEDDDGDENISSHSSSVSLGEGNPYALNAAQRPNGGRDRAVIRVAESGGKVWRPGSVSIERERHWARLLYDRPEERNENDMSQWLLSVLQVSDPATSLPSTSSSNGANESSGAANTGSGSTNNDSTSTSNGESGSGGSHESRPAESSSSRGSDEASPESKRKRENSEETSPESKRKRESSGSSELEP